MLIGIYQVTKYITFDLEYFCKGIFIIYIYSCILQFLVLRGFCIQLDHDNLEYNRITKNRKVSCDFFSVLQDSTKKSKLNSEVNLSHNIGKDENAFSRLTGLHTNSSQYQKLDKIDAEISPSFKESRKKGNSTYLKTILIDNNDKVR